MGQFGAMALRKSSVNEDNSQVELLIDGEISNYDTDLARDGDWHVLMLQEEIGQMTAVQLSNMRKSKRRKQVSIENCGREIGDAYAQVMLLATHYGTEFKTEIEKKWQNYLSPIEA